MHIENVFPCIQASGKGLYREPLVIPSPSPETNTDYKELDTNKNKRNSQESTGEGGRGGH